ncbi:MAG: hypothetical protein H6Q03_2538 [Acidobacteria bacterium]|nr:hypothetical protein [Acidobacteriota bacterium]
MCCGSSRGIYPATRSSGRYPDPATTPVARRRRGGEPANRYEYTGPTRLTVRAPLSGRTYVFDGHGAVLAVDPVDAAALATVPGLRPARD